MFRSFIFALLLVSMQAAYAGGCKAPEQGPQGPRGPAGVSSYSFFYTLTDQEVPYGVPAATVPASGFGVIEFDQNDPPGSDPSHVNINQAGFILHKNDSTHPERITAFEVPKTGDYQIIFLVTSKEPCLAFGLAKTTKSTFFPAANSFLTATVDNFTLLNPGSISANSSEIVLNCIVHLKKGTLLSIVNIGESNAILCPNYVLVSQKPVVASISFVYLGSGKP